MTANEVRVEVSASWDDRASLVGREFVSDWTRLTAEHVDGFEHATLVASNPHAVNGGEYPDGLVEGFHLLGMLDYLVNGVSFIDDSRWSGWNYGLDRVRFVSPVTTADAIRVRGSIVSITPRQSGDLVLYTCVVEVEGRDRPAMTAEWRVLWVVIDD